MASSSSFALDFLRRLLCARSAGGRADDCAVVDVSAPEPEGSRRSPCIVARLMGLDAMPPAAAVAQPPQQQLLRRSRLTAEGGLRLPCGQGDAAPEAGTVRPSASSLRDKPAYLRPENDMFLLLSFSPEERGATKTAHDDNDEEAERGRENSPGGARKQRRAHRRKLRFGDDDESGRRGCNAQSSSPVSVLEACDVHEESSTTTTTSSSLEDVEPCSATSEEAHFVASEQHRSSTRKLHTSVVVQLNDDTSPVTTIHSSRRCSSERERRNRMVAKNKSDDNGSAAAPDVPGMCCWEPVCRLLVGEDLKKNVEWLSLRDGANVVADEMGSEILDRLVCEATVELVQLAS